MWALGALMIALLVAIMLLLLVNSRHDQQEALRNQAALKALSEQNAALTEQVQHLLLAQQEASGQRTAVVSAAIADLQARTQAQLDEMERRMLARQRVLLAELVALRGRGAAVPVLVPVPTRTATPNPSPTPRPAPGPSPSRCEPRGHSGKCK
jgi:hypothetical protein